ncbi:MAG: nuclease-related domain-containing protein [Parcubacteria group bacterium]|jgi:hypothetical protein
MGLLLIGIFLLLPIIVIIASVSQKNNQSQPTVPPPSNLHGKRCFDTSTTGERELLTLLKSTLNTDEYYIFSDIIIPDCFNITTEIDHIVISNHGIFVIENKDYTGWIFGNPNHKKWTEVIRGGKKYSFQNPLHQNYGHKKALQKALPFVEPSRFYSIIAFSRRAEFKTDIPNDVFFYDEIPDVIKSITDERIDMPRVLLSIGKLSYLCQSPSSDRQEHVNNVVKKQSPSEDVS